MLVRIFAALLIGFLLGFETEKKEKPVGIVTAMLVALGPMLFVEVGKILQG